MSSFGLISSTTKAAISAAAARTTKLNSNSLNPFKLFYRCQSTTTNNKYIPRRALMYVPGDDSRKLRKASQLDVDCIALDCEDGVAINRKQLARDSIRAFYDSGLNEPPQDCLDKRKKSEWAVRLNAVDSGLCEEDLSVIVSGEHIPETLLLPKCDTPEDLIYFSEKLNEKIVHKDSLKSRINLIMYAESCKSIMNLPQIVRTSVELSSNTSGDKQCLFEPVGIVFGSDDFCASIGATRTERSDEILYARQRVVLVAKAFHLQAIDMVEIDYKNLDALRVQSEFGARMGYTGKQIIHPGQIDVVQKSFLPSQKRIDWAMGLLAAFQNHQKNGKGAFVYQDQMIDMPTVKQAQNILDIMKTVQ